MNGGHECMCTHTEYKSASRGVNVKKEKDCVLHLFFYNLTRCRTAHKLAFIYLESYESLDNKLKKKYV